MTAIHPRLIAEFLRVELPFFTVHLNPKVAGVVLPRDLLEHDSVALHIGDGLKRPILDLLFDEYGVRGTLSFAGAPFECLIPWHAIRGLEVPDGDPLIVWRKTIEAAKAPEEFPGRRPASEAGAVCPRCQGDGGGADLGCAVCGGSGVLASRTYWCPRRQREVDDCAQHGCEGSTCRYFFVRKRDRDKAALRLLNGGKNG